MQDGKYTIRSATSAHEGNSILGSFTIEDGQISDCEGWAKDALPEGSLTFQVRHAIARIPNGYRTLIKEKSVADNSLLTDPKTVTAAP